MKFFALYFLPFLLISSSGAQINNNSMPLYRNAGAGIDARVKDLLSRMTPEEKAGQLNQLNGGAFTGPAMNDAGQQGKMLQVRQGKVGSLLNVVGAADTRAIQEQAMKTRLGIPLLFGYDVIHGYKTIFPIPLAEACSWDISLMEKSAAVAAKEASSAGLHWTFAPMCDVSNDPRWGRVMEGAGEDTYLASLAAAARVRGFQGKLTGNDNIMACVKHFAMYGAVEGGKEYNTVDVSRVQVFNKYLPPYKAAVDAGAASVMNAFNIYEGIPASGNKFLVHDILKKKWGFKGFLVSDWNSFGEMITHGYATDAKDAALKALQAGSMMDMEAKVSVNYLPQLLAEKKITMQQLDEAAGKILAAKFRLGLFEDAYKFSSEEREKKTLFTAANRMAARQAAQRSIVLLKNKEQILPLAVNKKVALIGFYAKSKEDLFDFWIGQGKANDAVSLQEAVTAVYPAANFANGYNADNSSNETLINEAIANANDADVIIINIGISGKMAGEDRALTNPVIPDGQIALLKALRKTNKPIIAVVSAGRPLALTEAEPLCDAIVYAWILGTEHGNAITDVLTGQYNPSAKTVMSFPVNVGQVPVYYNHFNTGRPKETDGMGNWFSRYRDAPSSPQYPFGFGLSYSKFDYTDMQLNKTVMGLNDRLTVTVKVTNTGNYDGEEIVQLYIRDWAAAVVRPVMELKKFEKIFLKRGENKTVQFELTRADLSFMDAEGKTMVEAGKFSVFTGANSRDVTEKEFTLQ